MAKINHRSAIGALDINNPELVNQLCDAVYSKLTQRSTQHLTFNQGVAGSSPVRPTKTDFLSVFASFARIHKGKSVVPKS